MSDTASIGSARELVLRVLHELGESEAALPSLERGSLEHVAQVARPARHSMRMVVLDGPALPRLALPAFVEYGDQFAVLREVGPRAQLELASGARVEVQREALLEASGGRALELQPCLDSAGSLLRRLARFVGARPGELALVLASGAALAGLGLITPMMTRFAIDRALPEQSPKWLSLLALAALLVGLQRALFSWLQQRATLALHVRIEAAVATRLFEHLLRIPFPMLVRQQVGSWLETLRGAQRVHGFVTESLLGTALQGVMALVYGAALAFASPQLALAVGAAGGLLCALSLAMALGTARIERAQIDAAARQRDNLYELLRGMVTLIAAGAIESGLGRWLARMLDERALAMEKGVREARTRVLLAALREATQLGVFLWSAREALHGDLSVGTLVSNLMLSDQLLHTMRQGASLLTPWLNARTHVPRIDALLAAEDVTTGASGRVRNVRSDEPAVVLNDVWFRYAPNLPWVLEGRNLSVDGLAHYPLIARSGTGKSTMLRLIAGLYTPERGAVRVFGREPRQLRAEICYLPQEARLFAGTILQNLRLLSASAPHVALMEAAEESGLSEWVEQLPMGFETVLTSGALTLSGGQRQLIAWTAAMASERKLVLVDEALAQVDRVLRARLLRMADRRARTVISVEHERLTE
ncbi:MAG TPA: ATP-binding cassette domain-containing protein [Polyangiales bacterium]|nr:ATP-binding cassette domain-containing protein [Polyangiales bacterium]